MNEQDFFKKLEEINENIQKVEKAVKTRIWKTFFDGMVRGAGYIIGVAIALALIGWVLNLVGVIPAFTEQVDEWKDIVNQTTQTIPKR